MILFPKRKIPFAGGMTAGYFLLKQFNKKRKQIISCIWFNKFIKIKVIRIWYFRLTYDTDRSRFLAYYLSRNMTMNYLVTLERHKATNKPHGNNSADILHGTLHSYHGMKTVRLGVSTLLVVSIWTNIGGKLATKFRTYSVWQRRAVIDHNEFFLLKSGNFR